MPSDIGTLDLDVRLHLHPHPFAADDLRGLDYAEAERRILARLADRFAIPDERVFHPPVEVRTADRHFGVYGPTGRIVIRGTVTGRDGVYRAVPWAPPAKRERPWMCPVCGGKAEPHLVVGHPDVGPEHGEAVCAGCFAWSLLFESWRPGPIGDGCAFSVLGERASALVPDLASV